jgi:hypothetical protein
VASEPDRRPEGRQAGLVSGGALRCWRRLSGSGERASKIALEWMLDEAVAAGLIVAPAQADLVPGRSGPGYVRPDANAMMHESLRGMWRLAEFVPKRHYDWAGQKEGKRANLFRPRTIPGRLAHPPGRLRPRRRLRQAPASQRRARAVVELTFNAHREASATRWR